MLQEDWQIAKSLFQSAIDLPESERETFVEQNSPNNVLRDEVLRLIRQHSASGDFLASPLTEPVDPSDKSRSAFASPIGQMIGEFRILRRIGSGGMGTVYAAQQSSPDREVAVKLLHPTEMDSERGLRRFQHESQALARLQHPGIAQIYASGIHESEFGQQPWFAMELVDGVPLNQFSKANSLAVDQNLLLLVEICDAVQHAHDRGVIHRDLKPANILVQNRADAAELPLPKVVDFGVARVNSAQGHQTLLTAAGEIIGTIAYMSPEHVSGDPARISGQSDVYSLGVIGFELLSGVLPFDRGNLSLFDAIRSVETGEPKRLGDINPEFRGDLQAIFAKAMEQDLERRYINPRELADDLRRFLDRIPVVAQPPTAVYRAQKYVSRNRVLVGGVIATILALTIGLVLFAIEARHARQAAARSQYESDKATAVNNFITNDFMMKLLAASNDGPGKTAETESLVDQASANIASMFGATPSIEAAVRNEVGTIYYNLGAAQKAADQFSLALTLWEGAVGPEHPDTLKAVNNLGQCQMVLGNTGQAEALYERALAGRLNVLGEEDPFTLVTMNNQAELFRRTKRIDEAERILRRIVQVQQRVLGEKDKNTLISTANLGSLLIQRGEIEEALELHLIVFEATRETLGADHITTMYAGSRAAQTLLRAGREDQALEILLPILEQIDRLRGSDHPDTITTRRLLAKIYMAKANQTDAAAQLTLALEGARLHPEQMASTIEKILRDLDSLEKRP